MRRRRPGDGDGAGAGLLTGPGAVPVDPDGADLARLLAEDPGGPVVMLNLLRFRAGGRAGYREYARRAAEHLARHGGELLYAGDGSTALVAAGGPGWDAVLVVRYPSREAFVGMVTDPAYREVAALRRRALARTLLLATTPWGTAVRPQR